MATISEKAMETLNKEIVSTLNFIRREPWDSYGDMLNYINSRAEFYGGWITGLYFSGIITGEEFRNLRKSTRNLFDYDNFKEVVTND